MPKKTGRKSQSLKAEDYRLLAHFRHILRQFLVFSEEGALRLGLAVQQHQALLAIKSHGGEPFTVGDLARYLIVKHNSAVGLINRLVDAGYVVRTVDPADRRRAPLALTGNGEAVLERLAATHRAELRRIAPLLHQVLNQLHE